jgi:hypothetical protein
MDPTAKRFGGVLIRYFRVQEYPRDKLRGAHFGDFLLHGLIRINEFHNIFTLYVLCYLFENDLILDKKIRQLRLSKSFVQEHIERPHKLA